MTASQQGMYAPALWCGDAGRLAAFGTGLVLCLARCRQEDGRAGAIWRQWVYTWAQGLGDATMIREVAGSDVRESRVTGTNDDPPRQKGRGSVGEAACSRITDRGEGRSQPRSLAWSRPMTSASRVLPGRRVKGVTDCQLTVAQQQCSQGGGGRAQPRDSPLRPQGSSSCYRHPCKQTRPRGWLAHWCLAVGEQPGATRSGLLGRQHRGHMHWQGPDQPRRHGRINRREPGTSGPVDGQEDKGETRGWGDKVKQGSATRYVVGWRRTTEDKAESEARRGDTKEKQFISPPS